MYMYSVSTFTLYTCMYVHVQQTMACTLYMYILHANVHVHVYATFVSCVHKLFKF